MSGTQPPPPFVTHVLHGARFEQHSVPVDVLPELSAYRDLVVAVARALFFARNPTRKRVDRGFEDGFRLVLRAITDPGCAGCPLERVGSSSAPQRSLFPTDGTADVFEQARDLIAATIDAVGSGAEVPPGFPGEAAAAFNGFGRTLRDDEHIAIVTAGRTVRYDRARRKRLVLLRETTYEDRCDVVGQVVAFDTDKKSFDLRTDDRRVQGRLDALAKDAFDIVRTAAAHHELSVRITGTAAFDANDRLARFVKIDDVFYADDEGIRTELDVRKRLAVLAELEAGWLDGEGNKVDSAGLEWLANLLDQVEPAEPVARPYLYPTPEGGVLAEWSFPEAEVTAEFDLTQRRAEVVGTHVRSLATGREEFELDQPAAFSRLIEYVTRFGPKGMARA